MMNLEEEGSSHGCRFQHHYIPVELAKQRGLYSETSNTMLKEEVFGRTKERLAAIRGTAHGRHTDLGYVPLLGTMPRALCLKDRTIRSCQSLPVLRVVESFPGAPSSLGSKEPESTFFLTT
jgi:hypothetical protein